MRSGRLAGGICQRIGRRDRAKLAARLSQEGTLTHCCRSIAPPTASQKTDISAMSALTTLLDTYRKAAVSDRERQACQSMSASQTLHFLKLCFIGLIGSISSSGSVSKL